MGGGALVICLSESAVVLMQRLEHSITHAAVAAEMVQHSKASTQSKPPPYSLCHFFLHLSVFCIVFSHSLTFSIPWLLTSVLNYTAFLFLILCSLLFLAPLRCHYLFCISFTLKLLQSFFTSTDAYMLACPSSILYFSVVALWFGHKNQDKNIHVFTLFLTLYFRI